MNYSSLSAAAPKKKNEESVLVQQMRIVTLPKEELDAYRRFFLPTKTTQFAPIADELAVVSTRINGYMAFLRYCLVNARSLARLDKDALSNKLNEEAERLLKNVMNVKAIKEASRDFLGAMSSCKNHVIQPSKRFKGGYDIHYLGDLYPQSGPDAPLPTLSVRYNEYSLMDVSVIKLSENNMYTTEHLEAYSTELSIAAIRTGEEIMKALFGSVAIDPASAGKRLHSPKLLSFDFEQFNTLFTQLSGVVLKTDFMRNIPAATVRTFADYVTITPVRTPSRAVFKALTSQKRSPNELADYIPKEALALSQTLTFSFSINLPENITRYITQCAANEPISLSALHNWIMLWTRRYVKYTGQQTANGKLLKRDMPQFVLPISKSEQVTNLRRTNGYAIENGKTDQHNIFIGNNGALHYGLQANQRSEISANLNGYEATMAEYLEFCFQNGLPPQTTVKLSEDVKASVGDGEALSGKYAEIHEKVSSYSGKILSYDWDYSTVLTANITDPSMNSVDNTIGSAKLDPLTLADYLGYNFAEPGQPKIQKTFAESLVLMIDLRLDKKETPAQVIGYDDFLTQEKGPVAQLIKFYQTLLTVGYVPAVQTLLTKAAAALNIADLPSAPFLHKEIYEGVISDDLKFTSEGKDALTILLMRTLRHCAGGGTLRRIIAEENEGADFDTIKQLMAEHPHYFNPTKSTLGDFGNLYNYLGGKLFQLACEEILKVSPAKLFGTIPGDNSSYDKISKTLLPQAVMFAHYVPAAASILEQADVIAESNKPDPSISEHDIHVSGSKAGAQLFPHQVQTHGSLRRRPSFAVLDIAPGGGKTTLGLTDIAALIHDLDELGERVKPLVICPDKLIKNWVDDMKLSTGTSWNMIPVNTTIIDRWGYEKLEQTIRNAPINSIVVVGFDCLTSRAEEIVFGTKKVRISNNLEFIKRFGFDYICIDESHKLARKTSQRHSAVKQLTTASHVKYLRLATGTFIHGRVSDVIGQCSLHNGHIFREGDVLSARDDEVVVNGEAIPLWKVDTPSRARAKLARYAAVVTLKKKHWAFMLPSPVEAFFPIPLVPEDGDPNYTDEDRRMGELHKKLYDVVLHESMEELEKLLKGAKKKGGEDDDDEDESEEDDAESSNDDDVGDLDLDDEDDLNRLSAKDLTPYIARLERLITNPMADPLAPSVFGAAGLTHYNSTVARFISRRIDRHFNVQPWSRDKIYNEYELVSHNDKTYLAKKTNRGTMQKVPLPANTRGVEPQNNTDHWREEPLGKIIVFCRYTNSVNGVYAALPDKYKKIAVKYTGEEENKAANLDAFKSDDRVQILIANEMGIAEGHNLQLASRIIRVESPWNPGDLDQSASRIFRPDPAASKAMFESGKVGQLYREIIFLDWVLCDGTLHVQKQARLIAKIFNKARFDEADNEIYRDVLEDYQLDEIPMSLDILRSRSTLQDYQLYVDAYAALNGVMHKEFQEMRESADPNMRDLPVTPAVKGSYKIPTPFIANQKPEDVDNLGLISLRQLTRHDDVISNPESIVGMPVLTDLGKGRIAKVRFRYLKKAVLDKNGDPVYKTSESGKKTLQTEFDLDADGGYKLDVMNPISSVVVKTVDDEAITFNDPGLLYIPTKMTTKAAAEYNVRNLAITDAQKRRVSEEEEEAREAAAEEERQLVAEERRRRKARKEIDDRTEATAAAKQRKKNLTEGKPINAGVKRAKEMPAIPEIPAQSITIHPAYYHGYLTLEVRSDEVAPGALKKLKFKHTGPYVYARVTRYSQLMKVMDYMDDNFSMGAPAAKRLEAVQDAFETGGKAIYQMELAPIASLPYYFATSRKKVEHRKEIRPYPIILPDEAQIAIDPLTCPIIKSHIGVSIPGASTKWTLHDGHELFFAPDKQTMRNKVKELEDAGYIIANKQDALAEITNIKFRTAKAAKK